MLEIPRRGKTWEGEKERGTGVVILVYKLVGISINCQSSGAV